MKIGVPTEIKDGEARVAATPEIISKLTAAGRHTALVQAGAGHGANILDAQFSDAGATLVATPAEVYSRSDILLKVRAPEAEETSMLRSGSILIGMLNPFHHEGVAALARRGVTAFALEALPRTTRAQSMDVLSSQANIAGYKAVIVAADAYRRLMPMFITAAGTVKAARVLVLGVGVAGLQAIATAKRLGAVVEASDVRPPVKEQVESLGAKFIDVPYLTAEEREIAQGVGGYARPMPADWVRRQAELVHERALQSDIVITTALVPGRPAPKLIRSATVAAMKPGSVLIDLAVEQGGNIEGSELDRTVVRNNVTIIGASNLPALVAADASALYARNLFNFLNLLLDAKSGELKINRDDDVVAATLQCTNGEVIKK